MNKKRIISALATLALVFCLAATATTSPIEAAAKKPGKPTISSVKSSKAGQVTVKWKKVSKAKGYQIVLAKNSKYTSGKKTVNISGGTKKSTTIKKLTAGKKYYVKMRAYVKNGTKKVYGSWSKNKTVTVKKKATKKTTTEPKVDTTQYNVSISSVQLLYQGDGANKLKNASGFMVKWNKATGIKSTASAGGYQVQYSTSNDFSASTTKSSTITADHGSSTYSEEFWKVPGAKYYVRVRSYYNKSGKKVYGDWSAVKNITVPYNSDTPTVKATVTAPGTISLDLSLTPQSDYRAVWFEISTEPTFERLYQADCVRTTEQGYGTGNMGGNIDCMGYKKIDTFMAGTYYVRACYLHYVHQTSPSGGRYADPVGDIHSHTEAGPWSETVKVTVTQDASMFTPFKKLLSEKVGVTENMTEMQKAELITDYVASYPGTTPPPDIAHMKAISNLWGAHPCQGYTSLRWALYTVAGLESYEVGGYKSGASHMWSIVKVDGTWYYIDGLWNPIWTKTDSVLNTPEKLQQYYNEGWTVPFFPDTRLPGHYELEKGYDKPISWVCGYNTDDGYAGKYCYGFVFEVFE